MPDNQTREELAAEIERLRQDRAIAVAKNVEQVADKATNAREELAAKLAYAAGAEAARVDERLGYLDKAVEGINGSIEETGIALNELTAEVRKMRERSISHDAAANALAESVESRSKEQITTRTFLFSLIGAVGTISGVLWAAVSNV